MSNEDERRRKDGIKHFLPFFGQCLEKDHTKYDRMLKDWKNEKDVPEKGTILVTSPQKPLMSFRIHTCM